MHLRWDDDERRLKLSERRCAPCASDTPPMTREQAQELLPEIPAWALGKRSITREFTFKDFREAMTFVNRVADIAESAGHHPDLFISYNTVKIELWSHKIGGLSMNDFIEAAKIDQIIAT